MIYIVWRRIFCTYVLHSLTSIICILFILWLYNNTFICKILLYWILYEIILKAFSHKIIDAINFVLCIVIIIITITNFNEIVDCILYIEIQLFCTKFHNLKGKKSKVLIITAVKWRRCLVIYVCGLYITYMFSILRYIIYILYRYMIFDLTFI